MNAEHLKQLDRGQDAWAAWRIENPDTAPDLGGADLSGRDLSGFDLRWVQFGQGKLTAANLRGANLEGAYFHGTCLRDADFTGANLINASFQFAKLRNTNFASNSEHVDHLRQGVDTWNQWRLANPDVVPVLRKEDLSGLDLSGANLSRVDLRLANLRNITGDSNTTFERSDLRASDITYAELPGVRFTAAVLKDVAFVKSNLTGARFDHANLSYASLHRARLAHADFTNAHLFEASLFATDLTGAVFDNARVEKAVLVEANVAGASFQGCRIYGVSAWALQGVREATQKDMTITAIDRVNNPDIQAAEIKVDDIEVAQFLHLILRNENIRNFINATTSKIVLILGRFTPERMEVLQTLRQELGSKGYVPILFDFTPSDNRDLTETVMLLATMAKGVVADLSAAKSIPQELSVIVPNLPSVPVLPIITKDQDAYAMFEHWQRYPWVLNPFRYDDLPHLQSNIDDAVIAPLENRIRLRAIEAELQSLTRSLDAGNEELLRSLSDELKQFKLRLDEKVAELTPNDRRS